MIAKIIFFISALVAVHATVPIAHGLYGHGLAISAPAAPLLSKTVIAAPAAPVLHAPLLTAPVLTKSVIAAPAAPFLHAPVAPLLSSPVLTKSVVTTHHTSPLAYAAPLPYAVAKAAPVAYTTNIVRAAPVLGHTGLLGAAPLAYTGLLGHGLAYHGHGLAYGTGLVGPGKLGYGKVLL